MGRIILSKVRGVNSEDGELESAGYTEHHLRAVLRGGGGSGREADTFWRNADA